MKITILEFIMSNILSFLWGIYIWLLITSFILEKECKLEMDKLKKEFENNGRI